MTSNHRACLYAALGPDPRLRATWERYHLIGQVLRGEQVKPQVRAVAAAVRAWTDSVLSDPRRRAAAVRPRAWRPLFAGAALAASAAFLALLLVPSRYRKPARVAPAALAGEMPRPPRGPPLGHGPQ